MYRSSSILCCLTSLHTSIAGIFNLPSVCLHHLFTFSRNTRQNQSECVFPNLWNSGVKPIDFTKYSTTFSKKAPLFSEAFILCGFACIQFVSKERSNICFQIFSSSSAKISVSFSSAFCSSSAAFFRMSSANVLSLNPPALMRTLR